MTEKKITAATLARIAGNIAAGMVADPSVRGIEAQANLLARTAVVLARAVVAEVERTEPK